MWTLFASVAAALTLSELPPLEGHAESQANVHVTFDPSGVRLVSWADDGIRVWSPDDGELIHHIPGRPSQLVVGDRGRTAYAGYKNQALLLDLDTGRHLRSFATGWDWVEYLAADPQGRWVVIGDDSELRVLRYDAQTGKRLEVPEAVTKGHPRVFSPAGVLFWTDAYDQLNAWDPVSGESFHDDRRGFVARLDWSVDGGWLASVVWDWPSHQAHPWRQGWVRIRGPAGQQFELDETGYDAAISPDGGHVAIVRDSELRIVEVATGETVTRADTHGTASDVDWGPDHLLVVGTSAGPIRRYRVTP